MPAWQVALAVTVAMITAAALSGVIGCTWAYHAGHAEGRAYQRRRAARPAPQSAADWGQLRAELLGRPPDPGRDTWVRAAPRSRVTRPNIELAPRARAPRVHAGDETARDRA